MKCLTGVGTWRWQSTRRRCDRWKECCNSDTENAVIVAISSLQSPMDLHIYPTAVNSNSSHPFLRPLNVNLVPPAGSWLLIIPTDVVLIFQPFTAVVRLHTHLDIFHSLKSFQTMMYLTDGDDCSTNHRVKMPHASRLLVNPDSPLILFLSSRIHKLLHTLHYIPIHLYAVPTTMSYVDISSKFEWKAL